MPVALVGYRITGADTAAGKVQRFTPTVLRNIREMAEKRAEQAVFAMRTEMEREYTSAWATGLLAKGITHKAVVSGNGVDIKFYIQDRRELRYVTALLGGHFQDFPVGPFVINPVSGKALVIPLPGLARRFIRGRGGKFAGSRPGSAIITKRVLWGSRTGGFQRDVLREVVEREGALFVQDMQAAVGNAIVEMTS